MGDPAQLSRAFRTMRRLTPSGAYTPEEEHFAYDERGRLVAAAFAQTPAVDAQGHPYETSGATPYYKDADGDATAPGMASARCVAEYVRDAAGRVTTQRHWWENRDAAGTLASVKVSEETCGYEASPTSPNYGLKTSDQLSVLEGGGASAALRSRSDVYAYDADRGYLAQWSSSDQTTRNWAYDAAGNRTTGTYDALNRQTAFGSGVSYTVDAAGNRLTRTSGGLTQAYGWDPLNRMASAGGTAAGSYQSYYRYRADGLRVAQLRQAGTGTQRITAYRYDGTMPVEEVYTLGSTVETTRYAVGPRGTERQELTTGTGTDVSYPLYDAHGNAFASIRRDTANPGGYVPLASADVRALDPWGNSVSSTGFTAASSGRPNQRYCGSLGHRTDDETGLVYMRARYYDPQVGRFVSEDPAMDGANWFAYCSNDPVNQADLTGKEGSADLALLLYLIVAFFGGNGPGGLANPDAARPVVRYVSKAMRAWDERKRRGEGDEGIEDALIIALAITTAATVFIAKRAGAEAALAAMRATILDMMTSEGSGLMLGMA